MASSVGVRRWMPLFALAGAMLLFLVANRGAYKGYFDADDLDNIALARQMPALESAGDLFSARFYSSNFRPVGNLFYHGLDRLAGLNFARYITAIHLLHLANALLVWLLLLKLGFDAPASFAGTLFFAFEIAVFDAYWKPMYLFDLLCGFFCLLCLLAYLNNWLLPSLLAFWIAFRAKEVAIMLSLVLAIYEFQLREKRWKRLLPFFVLSLALGVQALLVNQSRHNDYTLTFSVPDVWRCIVFYASKLFLIPYAGFAILLLPLLVRDRRVRLGVAAFCILLIPMLLLPGRLFAVYLYVPLIGLAIGASAAAAGRKMAVIAAFFALWIPWNYVNLRWNRRTELAAADARRIYCAELAKVTNQYPGANAFVLIGGPMPAYGVSAAIRLLHSGSQPVVRDVEAPDVRQALDSKSVVVLEWDSQFQRMHVLPRSQDASHITMDAGTPLWQLEDGWLGRTGLFRWTRPSATARLLRPADAKQFELVANINPLYIETLKRSHVEVFIDGGQIGQYEFTHPGWQTVRWDLKPAGEGPVEVRFETSPPYPGDSPLGLAIGGFGFITR